MKLCCMGGATLFGYVGWFLAEAAGVEFFGAFVISSLASLLGVYVGWKLGRRFE